MSFVDGNGGLSAADVAAVTGNNGFGFGGDGAWWLIVLFLFAFAGNGWGGNGGFGGGGQWAPWLMTNQTSDVQRGFDQQAIMSGISGINASLANAEISRCNSQANILQAVNANQAATVAGMNTLAAGIQNATFANTSGIADLKYTVATEACADRSAVESALRDVLAAQTAGIQSIKDQMCQDKIDAKNEQIAALQNQLVMAQLAASQNAQTASILNDNLAQTQALEQYLNPAPIPAYVVQNPACCNHGYYNGCGCNA